MKTNKTLLVSDYMQKKVLTITKEITLREAVEKMLQEGTNGLVVINDAQKVTGILSTWDIIQYIVPDYLEEDMHLAPFEAADLFAKRIVELQNDPVSKFMTTAVHTCKLNHSLMEAASLVSEYRIRQLPIVDENDKLVGYISRTDIKKALGDVLGISVK